MKRLLFSGIRQLHAYAAQRPLPSKVAIYFHELEDHQWDRFRECIGYFRDHGWTTVTPDTFVASKPTGRQLFVSFDDNYASWHRSLPLLDELAVRATFYVNTLPFRDRCDAAAASAYFDRIAHRGERRALSRAELSEMKAAGHTIGCHSHSHFVLSGLPREAWDAEIKTSKQVLEDLLDEEIAHFSNPYGMRRHFSPGLKAYCRALGFRTIAAGIPGRQHLAHVDPLAIERTRWELSRTSEHNLVDLMVDGRAFERLTGRSAVG